MGSVGDILRKITISLERQSIPLVFGTIRLFLILFKRWLQFWGIREVSQACGDTETDRDMITVSVHVSRVLDFVSQNNRYVSLECARIHHECFPWQACIETLCFINNIFSSFCLQMTNIFLSTSSTIQVKAIPWGIFLIWDKRQLVKVCKTVSLFLRCVWAPVSVAMYAKYDSRGYASREHTKGICMRIRSLAKPLYYPKLWSEYVHAQEEWSLIG